VELVTQLGSAATERFLREVSPHLDAVQRNEQGAVGELRTYLHSCAVTAAIAGDVGGLDKLDTMFLEPVNERDSKQITADALIETLSSLQKS
jgi:hypothetical protein